MAVFDKAKTALRVFLGKAIRIEMTAKIPTQSGSWPALWTLGDYEMYGEWPLSGEIDLLEWVHQLGERYFFYQSIFTLFVQQSDI